MGTAYAIYPWDSALVMANWRGEVLGEVVDFFLGGGGGEEDDAGKCGTGDGVRRCGREGGLKHCEGQAVGGGGWRGRAPEGTRMRGGSSDRPSTAGEAGRVSKRRQESLEKHAGGTKLGARDADKEGKTRWGQAAGDGVRRCGREVLRRGGRRQWLAAAADDDTSPNLPNNNNLFNFTTRKVEHKNTPPLKASHDYSRLTSHESRLHGVHATNCHSTVGGRPQCPPRTPRPQYRFSVKNSIQNKTVCVSYSVTTRTPWAGNLSQSLAIYGFVMYEGLLGYDVLNLRTS